MAVDPDTSSKIDKSESKFDDSSSVSSSPLTPSVVPGGRKVILHEERTRVVSLTDAGMRLISPCDVLFDVSCTFECVPWCLKPQDCEVQEAAQLLASTLHTVEIHEEPDLQRRGGYPEAANERTKRWHGVAVRRLLVSLEPPGVDVWSILRAAFLAQPNSAGRGGSCSTRSISDVFTRRGAADDTFWTTGQRVRISVLSSALGRYRKRQQTERSPGQGGGGSRPRRG